MVHNFLPRLPKTGMPRPLRFVPENGLVEITTRTLQGRLLLRPSPELNDLILGIIGRAQDRYGMVIHAFVVTSTHAHYLLSPASSEKLARFMQFVNTNIVKEAGWLHRWPERLWSRRYRSIVPSSSPTTKPPWHAFATCSPTARKKDWWTTARGHGRAQIASLPLAGLNCCAEPGSTAEPSTKPGSGARLCWPGSSPLHTTSS